MNADVRDRDGDIEALQTFVEAVAAQLLPEAAWLHAPDTQRLERFRFVASTIAARLEHTLHEATMARQAMGAA